MNFTKDEYILRNFYKVRHKKWELYIITRIIHSLNDPEIEFVCQQLVKTSKGRRYTDLCFPSLKLYYEIDEEQHATDHHKKDDDDRRKEIVDTTGWVEKRIKIFEYTYINEINDKVDNFVIYLKQRKKELLLNKSFIPWNYENKFDPKPHLERGYLDIKDNIGFKYHKDALRCFGYKSKNHYQQSTWRIKGTNKYVWFPKLYENKDWNNIHTKDSKKIIMKRKDNSLISTKKEKIDPMETVIVFAHQKGNLEKTIYKFIGEFDLLKSETDKYKYVHIRKKTKINLKDYK